MDKTCGPGPGLPAGTRQAVVCSVAGTATPAPLCPHTEGPREISHDDATAPAGNLDDLDHLQEVVAEKEHVGAFACDLGAGTHRYSDVGFHQRGSIVDPIANHCDRLPSTGAF